MVNMEEEEISEGQRKSDEDDEFLALSTVIRALQDLDSNKREKIFATVATFFNFRRAKSVSSDIAVQDQGITSPSSRPVAFSRELDIGPKEFLFEKQPKSDVERVACLAYFLTHYRDTPYFRTLDLSKINTEAAQPKFSNAAYATSNALKLGYLAPAIKGQKQLSAAGEQFVRSLPDRDAAKAAMLAARPRRKNQKKKPENKA